MSMDDMVDHDEIAAAHAIVAAAAVVEQGQALQHRPEDIAADAHAAAEEAYDLYLHLAAHAEADDAHAASHAMTVGRRASAHPSHGGGHPKATANTKFYAGQPPTHARRGGGIQPPAFGLGSGHDQGTRPPAYGPGSGHGGADQGGAYFGGFGGGHGYGFRPPPEHRSGGAHPRRELHHASVGKPPHHAKAAHPHPHHGGGGGGHPKATANTKFYAGQPPTYGTFSGSGGSTGPHGPPSIPFTPPKKPAGLLHPFLPSGPSTPHGPPSIPFTAPPPGTPPTSPGAPPLGAPPPPPGPPGPPWSGGHLPAGHLPIHGGHHGFELDGGGDVEFFGGVGVPEYVVEAPCPLGTHLEEFDDGSIACVPDEVVEAEVLVGHGGGGHHGGGGGGGHHHGGGFGGGTFLVDEGVYPVIAEPCPPGSHLEQLADGSLACIPDVIVGHGGHGGGGHGHGGRGGRFIWGGLGAWSYPGPFWPVVVACGPGQVLLADGTCANVAVGPVTVGAQIPNGTDGWDGGEPVCCRIEEDGTVMLPDGSTVNAHDLDWSDCMHAASGATVGDSTSEFPPFTGETSMPAASTTGPTAQQHATADAINANWIALSQMVAQNPTTIGANPTLPAAWAPLFDSTLWLDDWNNWQAYYAAIGTLSFSQLESLNSWQDYANAWGSYFRKLAPNAPLPPNYPVTVVSPTTLPNIGASASSTAQLLEWIVIATCVGVGLWVLWPVLAGAHGALAAA